MPRDYLLFNRYVSIQAGGILLNGLDATFTIEKNMKSEPNKCELRVYNLNPDNRKKLESLNNTLVEIRAGYSGLANQRQNPLDDFTNKWLSSTGFVGPEKSDDTFRVFKGDVVQIFSQREGPDWVTILRTADGISSHQLSRIDPKQATFKKSATIKDVVTTLLKGLRVDTAGAIKKILSGDIPGSLETVLNSYTMYGAAHVELEKHMKKMNVAGFIEDNQLIILKPKETLGTEVVVLSADTGLIGSPELTDDGLLRCKTLIRPEIRLGHRLQIKSASGLAGQYRIERLSYDGSTFDVNWFVDIEATPL